MKKQHFIYLLLSATLLSSCLKDHYDTANGIEVDYSAKFALPLINTDLKTSDLLNNIDTTLITAGSDHVLKVMKSDTIKTISFSDLMGSKTIESTSSLVLNDIIDATTKSQIQLLQALNQALPVMNNLDAGAFSSGPIVGLDSVKLKSATLTFTVANNTPIPINNVKIKLSTRSGVIDTVKIASIPANSNSVATLTVSNVVIDSINFDLYSFGTPGKPAPIGIMFSNTETLDFTIKLSNVNIDKYFGDLSAQSIPAVSEVIDFDFGSDPLLQKFKFSDPKITLHFDNSFGIPFKLDPMSIKFKNASSSTALTGISPFNIAAGTLTNSVTTDLTIDKTNQLATALNSAPKQVEFNVLAGATGTKHFALNNSKFVVRMNVEIPMKGKLENIEVRDTIDAEGIGKAFEFIKSITLRTIITNEFPLDGYINIIFVDANYNKLDSLVSTGTKFMAAATVENSMGYNPSAATATDFVLDAAKAAKLVTAKKAIVVARIGSANNGTTEMKIYSTSKMNVKLGVITQIKYTIQTKK